MRRLRIRVRSDRAPKILLSGRPVEFPEGGGDGACGVGFGQSAVQLQCSTRQRLRVRKAPFPEAAPHTSPAHYRRTPTRRRLARTQDPAAALPEKIRELSAWPPYRVPPGNGGPADNSHKSQDRDVYVNQNLRPAVLTPSRRSCCESR